MAKGGIVQWHIYVAYFFGGVFLMNSVSHFTNGVSGRRFPTPFATPLRKGQSSPTVNVLWGILNLVIRCGGFTPDFNNDRNNLFDSKEQGR